MLVSGHVRDNSLPLCVLFYACLGQTAYYLNWVSQLFVLFAYFHLIFMMQKKVKKIFTNVNIMHMTY